MSDNQIIGFIGFGNMGSAIAYSICDHLNVSIMVSEPDSSKHNVPDAYRSQIKFCTHAEVFKLASIVFLAIKPQVLLNIVDDISSYVEPHHLVVSMLAGTSVESLGSHFNTTQLVRIMPNTPALLGKGVTGIFFNPPVLKDNRDKIRHICDGFGYAFELDKEEQMHAITALSGSGPAFFYRIVAVFAQFAQVQGLDKAMSLNVALNTMLGAGAMLAENLDPDSLINQVASPNGTTQAGLNRMDELNFDQQLDSVLMSAYTRSVELSRGEK